MMTKLALPFVWKLNFTSTETMQNIAKRLVIIITIGYVF